MSNVNAVEVEPLGSIDPSGPRTASGTGLDRAGPTEADLRHRIDELEQQLKAKSDLLTEVNHRAKNSLQMAMALLSMQALACEDSRVASALHAAMERLGHLSRVHELLYQRGDDIQEIDISSFLRDIGGALEEAFKREDVELRYEVSPLKLDVGRGTSVALIVGEAVLNSYKYAFPAGASGTITIRCKLEGEAISLVVRDDGGGFPAEQRRGSLGMRLLRALGRSLGGETVVTSGDDGTEVSVSFPSSPPKA